MSELYDSILQGLNEAVEYSKGNCKKARVHTVGVEPLPAFDADSIKAVRSDLGMTQVCLPR